MAKLKKPKMKKFPLKPKRSSSSDTMERYLDKIDEIRKGHAKNMKSYIAELSKREKLIKKVRLIRR